ncbi:MAG: hypothetical protein ACKN9T_00375 [Candidatus Methylumidiphilus sp.]
MDDGHIQLGADADLRNLAAALFRLEQSRTPADMLAVVRSLRVWLQAPEQASLRRAFTTWMDQVLLPRRLPGIDFSPIHNLQEAETMLAERVKAWTEEWEQAGMQKGMKQGLQKGMQQGMRKGQREAQRAIARALLDIIADDALLAERTGVPVAEIAAMRREQPSP